MLAVIRTNFSRRRAVEYNYGVISIAVQVDVGLHSAFRQRGRDALVAGYRLGRHQSGIVDAAIVQIDVANYVVVGITVTAIDLRQERHERDVEFGYENGRVRVDFLPIPFFIVHTSR